MQGTPNDEAAIRRTLAGYCQHCDDGRFDQFAELFTEDASFHVPPAEPVVGREAIGQFMERAQPPERRGKHLCGEPLIDLADDQATARTDFVFVGRGPDRSWAVVAVGRYQDRLARDAAGVWRLAERTIHLAD